MRTIIICLILAAAAIYLIVRTTAPVAMHGNGHAGAPEATYPPNTSTSSSVVAVPHPSPTQDR